MYEINQEMITKTRKLINDNFAQIDSEKDRFHQENNRNHLGEEFEKYSIRSEFSRDADRIIYSKAFRRLEHKAQVYSNKKGDHYRTRLTHTLEVTQIARSISRNLGLNEQLAEAIALGHDIGHTPFGHAGEAVLDDIMRGKDDLGGKLEFNIDYGGFKHNFNCLKILEIVEKREKGIGLNLTWQTLDGILKHTKVIKGDKKWDLSRFVRKISNYENLIKYDYFDNESKPNYEHPLTLEGQVVAISDEIAQREHDLDDSLRDGKLFRFEEMSKKIKSIIEETKDEITPENIGHNLFMKFYDEINQQDQIENTTEWKNLTSIIISYFILDVTENTMRKLNECKTIDKYILIHNDHKYITEELISFSEIGQKVNDKIDKFVEKRIINSFNVNRFDGKGKFILRQLFKAYYENPRQMPRKQLIILIRNIESIIKEYPILKCTLKEMPIDLKELSNINENYVDLNNLKPMLDILKLNRNKFGYDFKNIENPNEFMIKIFNIINFDHKKKLKESYDFQEIIDNFSETLFNFCNSKTTQEINKHSKDDKNFLLFVKGWNELHYAYLTTICEYISQMTDDYAIKEYHELYLD